MTTDLPTAVGSAIVAATSELTAAGCESARLDARLLVAHVASVPLEAQIRAPGRLLPEGVRQRLREAVARRARRVPLAHIIGEKEFWSLPFTVTADVLIPRPDSEVVVDSVLRHLGARAWKKLRVLDLGTGSGCLLQALISAMPQAVGVGIDVSTAALDVATTNARRLGLESRARFEHGNWGEYLSGEFDVIVANPPYIRSGDLDGLAPELAHEPRLALDGGPDGLAAYRQLLPDIAARLAPDGIAAVEIGSGQAAAVAALAVAYGLTSPHIECDIAGTERCLIWVWQTVPQYEKRLGNRGPNE